MTKFETLQYHVSNRVATITLNRPQVRNALNRPLRTELIAAVGAATADDEVRAVVLAANGEGFSAGADLTERLPDLERKGFVTEVLETEYNPLILGIRQSAKPFVAGVNGTAAGIGASLAMACDLVVMAEDACLYPAFGTLSLVPDGGQHKFLLEQMGPKRAFEAIALSQKLGAERCLELGLANRVVPETALRDEVQALAERLAAAAPLTLANAKRILFEAQTATLAESMKAEAIVQDDLIHSRDFREGTAAFFNRRLPRFEGR